MNKVSSTLLGVVFLASLFGMMTVRQYYTRKMPETIQMESGRTIALHVNYGKTVYVSAIEKRNWNLVHLSFGVAAVSVLLLVIVRSGRALDP